MENDFTITVSIKDHEKFDNNEHKTEYWGNNYCDHFQYINDQIIIKGERKSEVLHNNHFYTIKSTSQFSTLKALLYYWLKYGKFTINSINLRFGNDKLIKKSALQNFKKDPCLNITDQQLNELLNLDNKSNNNNDFITALTYQMISISSDEKELDNAWRCFNHIYKVIYVNTINYKESHETDKRNIKKLENKKGSDKGEVP